MCRSINIIGEPPGELLGLGVSGCIFDEQDNGKFAKTGALQLFLNDESAGRRLPPPAGTKYEEKIVTAIDGIHAGIPRRRDHGRKLFINENRFSTSFLDPDAHRVGDPRIVRLIQKWLKAGVSEEGQMVGDEGRDTARGSGIAAARQRVPARTFHAATVRM